MSNECLKTDAITEADVKRLEVYSVLVTILYSVALFLPFSLPFVYLAFSYKTKDPKFRFDERVFNATQLINIIVTCYVCLMPFVLAVHQELVTKTIFGMGEVFEAQNDGIWLIHGNLFRIMLLLFFRLMTIDMTLF